MTAYRDRVHARGALLHYWPMDEAGGTTLASLHGGVDIAINGATPGVTGQVDGTAVSFDGVNDSGQTESALDLTAYNKVVVEGLYYFDEFNDTDDLALEFSNNFNNNNGSFILNPDATFPVNNIFGLALYENDTYSSAEYSRPTNAAWHHIVAVYDMSLSTDEINLYIDGTLISVTTRTHNNNHTGSFGNFILYLMSRAGSSLFCPCDVQHLAIYSGLTAAEVLDDYNVSFAVAPTITNAEDEALNYDETDFVITCTNALSIQGANGKVWLSDSASWGAGTRVEQIVASWENGSITISCAPGALTSGTRYLWIETDGGQHSTGYPVTFTAAPQGWQNVVEMNGIATSGLSKINSTDISEISKLNGITV